MNKKISAMDVANYIVWYVNNNFVDNLTLTPLKLQKVLYYVHAEYLARNNGKPLFNENVEKWQYGPVVRNVYFEFKIHGTDHIQFPHSILKVTESTDGIPSFEMIEFNEDVIESCPDTASLIKDVVDKLIEVPAFDLVEKTHQEPMWADDKVRILSGERGLVYDNAEITKYFQSNRVL
ncbi:type II toxin-antitoxin system antitoxin SocA domain-containing protein [Acinetobacter baumannii]